MFLDRMIAGFWDIVIVFVIFSSLISSKSQSFAFQKDIQISSVCARKSFQQRSVFSGWKSLRKFVSSLEQQRMRAWTCHGRSQKQLVDNLASAGIIKSQIVKDVMIKVDRMNYVLPSSSSNAYGE